MLYDLTTTGATYRHGSRRKLYAYRCFGVWVELVSGKTTQQIGFPNTGIAYQHNLEQVVMSATGDGRYVNYIRTLPWWQ